MKTFDMPQLPYSRDALAPVMSSETIDYHFGKHLQTYVTNLNNLLPGSGFEGVALEDIIRRAEGAIFNNAAQVYNHTLFFNQMSPTPKKLPNGKLMKAIERDFSSFEKMKEMLLKVSLTQFGSGWGWLVSDTDGKLSVLATSNAGNPLRDGFRPLINLDVWEHSYYIDYRNRRADYLEATWNLIDWNGAEIRFCV